MALKKLLADVSIISKLSTNPGLDDGLSEEQLKAKFDEAANIIKDYINNYLVLEIEKTVDVESLLANILDVTLSKSDKAANAKATGDAIRDLRAFIDRSITLGNYVLPGDGEFSASITGDTTIRVNGGFGVIQANPFSLHVGGYEDITIQPGTYGLNRADLICVRCESDGNGGHAFSLRAITGENTSAVDPPDPAYAAGDINSTDEEHDFPLYRIVLNGYDIVKIKKLFRVGNNNMISSVTVTIPLDAWIGESAPFTQTIEVEGILETDNPHYGVVLSGTQEQKLAQKEAFGYIDELKTADGIITFNCLEGKPDVDLTVQIECNRSYVISNISEAVTLKLDSDVSGYKTVASIDGEEYGIKNATVNQAGTAGSYNFTVL